MCFFFVNDYARHSGKESTCQCRGGKRHKFHPWVRKIPWRRKWQPTPVFLPGKSHGWRSLAGYSPGVTKSWTRLSMHVRTHTPHLSLLHIPEFTKAMNNESDLNSSQSLHFWSLLERAVKW